MDALDSKIHPVLGIRLGTTSSGTRYQGRDDITVIEALQGATMAAVFTRNAFCAAPVTLARNHLGTAEPRCLLINSGNANAGTGKQGMQDAAELCTALAGQLGCTPEQVLPFSTGVIGEPMPVAGLAAVLPAACKALSEEGWQSAAAAILTTDTRPKHASKQIELNGKTISITGICKGSGMICPNMATMLGFVACDAAIEKSLLQTCLVGAMDDSFNAITVDGDTSTNDACVLIASGASGVQIQADSAELEIFKKALNEVCQSLAQAIVRDGEGATKFITVQVVQGRDRQECRDAAYTIAHSPLVKTAFFASDANWGRILAALGRSGIEAFDLDKVEIYLDEVCIVQNGERGADYQEVDGQRVMNRQDITIRVVLGRGEANARVWTTDLSHEYVRINADYRS